MRVAIALALLGHAAGALADAAPAPLEAIQSAQSDDRGRIFVNGKPFFPILLYDVPSDLETLRKIRAHGFNTVTVSKPEEAEAAWSAGLYGAAHGRKIQQLESILFGIGIDSPVINLKPPLLENLRADLEKARTAIPGRPIMHAIGYWLHEPAGVVAGELPPRDQYDAVVQAIDVAAPYLYPVPYQPVRTVGDAVSRAVAATAGRKPVLPILQIFRWTADDRFPSAAELRCMAYLSLIHGARGLGFYSYNHVTGKKGVTFEQDQPETWASLKELNQEVLEYAPFLLDGNEEPGVTAQPANPEVTLRALQLGDAHLLLLANSADREQELTVTLAREVAAAPSSIGRGGSWKAEGKTLTVKLGGYGALALKY